MWRNSTNPSFTHPCHVLKSQITWLKILFDELGVAYSITNALWSMQMYKTEIGLHREVLYIIQLSSIQLLMFLP